jgi:hypothetical protein
MLEDEKVVFPEAIIICCEELLLIARAFIESGKDAPTKKMKIGTAGCLGYIHHYINTRQISTKLLPEAYHLRREILKAHALKQTDWEAFNQRFVTAAKRLIRYKRMKDYFAFQNVLGEKDYYDPWSVIERPKELTPLIIKMAPILKELGLTR